MPLEQLARIASVPVGAMDVTVALRNEATNFEQVVISNARGTYRGLLLPLGPYELTVQIPGKRRSPTDRTGNTLLNAIESSVERP